MSSMKSYPCSVLWSRPSADAVMNKPGARRQKPAISSALDKKIAVFFIFYIYIYHDAAEFSVLIAQFAWNLYGGYSRNLRLIKKQINVLV